MKCENKDMSEKERKKKTRSLRFFLCAQNRIQQSLTAQFSDSVCPTFTTVNPTKSTPIMMKIGDNTIQDVYKHPKLKLLKNIVWFDHKSNFTTHIQIWIVSVTFGQKHLRIFFSTTPMTTKQVSPKTRLKMNQCEKKKQWKRLKNEGWRDKIQKTKNTSTILYSAKTQWMGHSRNL